MRRQVGVFDARISPFVVRVGQGVNPRVGSVATGEYSIETLVPIANHIVPNFKPAPRRRDRDHPVRLSRDRTFSGSSLTRELKCHPSYKLCELDG